jgi:hypothetical protein
MKLRLLFIGCLSVIVLLSFYGCSDDSEKVPKSMRIMKYTDLANPSVGKFEASGRTSKRLIITAVNMVCEVEGIDSTANRIQQFVQSYEGYVSSSSSQTSEEGQKTCSLVLRIPINNYQGMLIDITKSVKEVISQSTTGTDVTEEYFDVAGRLENKKALESRYRYLLRTARTTKDMLEIERSLSEVRDEIDRLEGREKYLSNRIDYATISIELREYINSSNSSFNGFWHKLGSSFKKGLVGFGDVLSFCITILIGGIPAIVLIAIIIFIAIKVSRRYSQKKQVQINSTDVQVRKQKRQPA